MKCVDMSKYGFGYQYDFDFARSEHIFSLKLLEKASLFKIKIFLIIDTFSLKTKFNILNVILD